MIEPEGVDTSALKKIGEEITFSADYRPATLVVIRRVRPKYVDPREEGRGVLIGSLPARPVEKGIADPTLADAILDRLIHNAHHITLKGESMRKRLPNLNEADHL